MYKDSGIKAATKALKCTRDSHSGALRKNIRGSGQPLIPWHPMYKRFRSQGSPIQDLTGENDHDMLGEGGWRQGG